MIFAIYWTERKFNIDKKGEKSIRSVGLFAVAV